MNFKTKADFLNQNLVSKQGITLGHSSPLSKQTRLGGKSETSQTHFYLLVSSVSTERLYKQTGVALSSIDLIDIAATRAEQMFGSTSGTSRLSNLSVVRREVVDK